MIGNSDTYATLHCLLLVCTTSLSPPSLSLPLFRFSLCHSLLSAGSGGHRYTSHGSARQSSLVWPNACAIFYLSCTSDGTSSSDLTNTPHLCDHTRPCSLCVSCPIPVPISFCLAIVMQLFACSYADVTPHALASLSPCLRRPHHLSPF